MEKLRFNTYAWAKLRYLRDKGRTEVGFMAVTLKENPSLVIDVVMPKQINSYAFVEFKEEVLHEFYERMVDDGYDVEEFARIWCHTHPGDSAHPSGQDEETFKKEFGNCHWAIMFILGKTDQTTCRIKYMNHPNLTNVLGTHTSKEIPVFVDYNADTWAVNSDARKEWDAEYAENWSERVYTSNYTSSTNYGNRTGGYSGSLTRSTTSTNLERTSSAPRIPVNWRDQCDTHVWGPGWRYTKGGWVFDPELKKTDLEKGLKVSPDWDDQKEDDTTLVVVGGQRPMSQDFRERFDSDAEKGKRQIGFHQSGYQRNTPQTTHTGGLTKREKKYLKKHGTLEGFVPPVNKGYKEPKDDLDKIAAKVEEKLSKLPIGPAGPTAPPVGEKKGGFIPVEKLECSRNLLDISDDWAKYAKAAASSNSPSGVDPNFTQYDVTLDDDTVITGVWAYGGGDAIKRVFERMDIAPQIAVASIAKDDEFDFPEPTDDQLKAIEKEQEKSADTEEIDLEILPFEDEGEDTVLEVPPVKLLKDMTTEELEGLSDEDWQAAVEVQAAHNEGMKLYQEHCLEEAGKPEIDKDMPDVVDVTTGDMSALGDQFPNYPLLASQFGENEGFDVLG